MNNTPWFNDEPVIVGQSSLMWMCPLDCGGQMVSDGEALMTNPKGYFHKCDKCGHTAILRGSRYPINITFDAEHEPKP